MGLCVLAHELNNDNLEWIQVPGLGTYRRFVSSKIVDSIEKDILSGLPLKRISVKYNVSTYVIHSIFFRLLEDSIRDKLPKLGLFSQNALSSKLIAVKLCLMRLAREFKKSSDKLGNEEYRFFRSKGFVKFLRERIDNNHSNPLGYRFVRYFDAIQNGLDVSKVKELEDSYKAKKINQIETLKSFVSILKSLPVSQQDKYFLLGEFCRGLSISSRLSKFIIIG